MLEVIETIFKKKRVYAIRSQRDGSLYRIAFVHRDSAEKIRGRLRTLEDFGPAITDIDASEEREIE